MCGKSMLKIKKMSKERKKMLYKLLVVFSFPFFLCFVYCVFRGINIFNLYLPNSHNNDSLFYYKLVEGILSEGIPKGYYGYNESRALVGSFAAWSPALLLPWTIWGFIFGWGYSSIFISNIVYFAIALGIFVYLTEMEWENIIMLFLVLSLYPSLPIHLLSALLEVVVASVMIIFFGFAIKAAREEYKMGYIVGMCICGIYLTICRPYMVILLLLPCYYLFKKKIKTAYLYTIMILGISGVLYYACNHFLTSEYFTPLFDLSILERLLQGGISEAFWLTVVYVKEMFRGVLQFIKGAFDYGLTAGTQYVVSVVTVFLLSVSCFMKKKKEKRPASVIFIINFVCLFLAIFLFLRKPNEGGRHVWAFSVIGCVLCLSYAWCKRVIISGAILVGLLGIFLIKGSMIPTDYDVPVMDEGLERDVAYWKEIFTDKGISVTNELGYHNTCVWVLTDSGKVTNHKELFALPEGMGISCCTEEYVLKNIDSLKCRYIATIVGGKIEFQCEQNNFTEIGRTENVVIYQRY